VEGYESEKEQVEHIRKWWKENGTSIIAGLVIGLAALGGWRYWESRTHADAIHASAVYDVMQNHIRSNDLKAAVEAADRIVADYTNSTYATLAELSAVRLHVEQGDDAAARARLESVLAQSGDDNFKHIARIWLGRLLLAEGKFEDALRLVEGIDAGEYGAAYAELRGDIMAAQGNAAKAGDDYRAAIAALTSDHATYRELLEMKLGNLGLPTEEGK
jgi:predicted negative regulator of RcsB-dependent stress response